MKQFILGFFFLGLAAGLSAQANEAEVRKATDEVVSLYELDGQQAETMYEIQERRFRNLAAINALRQTDPSLYLQKKNSIREGTMASTRRLLRPDQMNIFNQQLASRREKEAVLRQQLKEEGATKEAIQLAIWQLE